MLATYKVKYRAKDGTEVAPQSGAAAIEIKVDGTKAFSQAPGCATRNCELSGEWTLEASKYANGEHTLEVIAKDGVGLASEPRKQKFTITHDESVPQLTFSGTATEQASLGMTLPRYSFTLKATDPAGTFHSGVASETIKIDGKTIDSYGPGCGAAGSCSIERGLTLAASGYTVGQHSLEATATDAAGNKATKTLSFRVDPDTTAPQITLSNALAEAPEGWVEQHNYNLTATATDVGGYGSKQITIKVDGLQVGQSAAQGCEWGSCQSTKTQAIEAAKYTGGAHELQVIASDNAGNQRTAVMTMNVDPDDSISVGESTDTLEALAETSPVNPVGPSESEAGYEGTAPGLELEEGENGFEATGTHTPITINTEGTHCKIELETLPQEALAEDSEEPSEDLEEALEAEEQEAEEVAPISVTPLASSGPNCTPTLVNESAAVEPNIAPEADGIIRPLYDGSMFFASIRGPEAPEEYSWEFHLGEELELKSTGEQTAGVYWSNGVLGMGIAATPAHDGAGEVVPTTLSVIGKNVVALTVHYRGTNRVGKPFTYPIVAGSAIQVGYEEKTVTGPAPAPVQSGTYSKQLPDGRWLVGEGGPGTFGPPDAEGVGPAGGAQASGVWTPQGVIITRPFKAPACWKMQLQLATPEHPGEEAPGCMLGTNMRVRGWVHGHYHYETEPHIRTWWVGGRENEISCNLDYRFNYEWMMWPKQCFFSGQNQQEGEGAHLVARNSWRVETSNPWLNTWGYKTICMPMYAPLYANRNAEIKAWRDEWMYSAGPSFTDLDAPCSWPE
jgi:hypothetical protein